MRMSGFGQTLVDLLRRRYSHCLPDFKAASDLKSTLQRLLPAASGDPFRKYSSHSRLYLLDVRSWSQ